MYDLIIVGAGIAGLAFGLTAAEAGKSVLIIEQNASAQGASIRNFGMVLPIGMPTGKALNRAIQSRDKWLHYSKEAKFWSNPCGMLMAAHHEDEMVALREFHNAHSLPPYQTRLLNADQCEVICPGINPRGLIGGMLSQTDVQINPQQAIPQLTLHFKKQPRTRIEFNTRVQRIDTSEHGVEVRTNTDTFRAKKLVCCPGHEFNSLLSVNDAKKPIACKLQMLRTVPQKRNWAFGSMLSTGLSMIHYPAFHGVESLKYVKERIEYDHHELLENGIHLLAAQNQYGEITLGDSHHYGDNPDPFINEHINELILNYAKKVIQLPDWKIKERWIGIYSKYEQDHVYWTEPQDHVFLITGLGGTGMSTSFAIAEEWLAEHSQ